MSDEFDGPRKVYKWSEIQWAKSAGPDSEAAMRRANAVWAAGKRMIARGERPMYRVSVVPNERGLQFTVVELPWVSRPVTGRREVLPTARGHIADWFHADPDAFDVELAHTEHEAER